MLIISGDSIKFRNYNDIYTKKNIVIKSYTIGDQIISEIIL